MESNFSKKEKYIQNGVFLVLMAISAVFLIWKCQYGFANVDESLYVAIPYRILQGDGLFIHEWNLSSLSSFLLMPIIWLYMAIVGTTEGILLNFRYIFVAVQALTALFLYFKLKRYNWIGAVVAAISFFIYAPFSITALSYNSVGIQCVAVAAVIVMTNESGKKADFVIAGVLFAASVLCCPFLVVGYLVYTIAVVVNIFKKFCTTQKILQKEGWFWITAGISILAVLFLIFVLSRAGISDILTALTYMLNDPQHKSQSVFSVFSKYIKGVLICNSISIYIFAAFAVLIAFYIVLKYKKSYKAVFFCIGCVLTGLLMMPFVTWQFYINYVMFPVNILGLFCVIISENKVVKKLFAYLWIPGFVYGICIHFASTEGFLNIASVSSISLLASIIIVVMVGKEVLCDVSNKPLQILVSAAVVCVLAMQVITVGYTRYVSVFWESGSFGGGMHTQTQRLSDGPEKGILASAEKEKMYNMFMEDIAPITKENSPENILYISQNTWLYLASENSRNSSFSPWLPGKNEQEMQNTVERLLKYLELNPDKMPDVIFVEEKYNDAAKKMTDKLGFSGEKTKNGNYIYKR